MPNEYSAALNEIKIDIEQGAAPENTQVVTPPNKVETSIKPLKDILNGEFKMPYYQRPYRWEKKSAALLITDTYKAFLDSVHEYRLGSIILFENPENGELQIVDGQQRLTTLSVLFYAISEQLKNKNDDSALKSTLDKLEGVLNQEYGALSKNAIIENYKLIKNKIGEIQADKNLVNYTYYLLNRCTIVKIITNVQHQAFLFFDSQNHRGKALEPHDLLKAYHLREMHGETEQTKLGLVQSWEEIEPKDLKSLFENNLYPLVNWYWGNGGLDYSVKDIDIFKGIKSEDYNFIKYARAARLYVENFNAQFAEFMGAATIDLPSGFLLTQPFEGGKRFFYYCLYYNELHKQIDHYIKGKYDEDKGELPYKGTGDGYVYEMLINALMFFVDRFNMDALTKMRLDIFYTWAYYLRVKQSRVYDTSVNRYALGVDNGLNLFKKIARMNSPEEIEYIDLNIPELGTFEDFKKRNNNKLNDRYRPLFAVFNKAKGNTKNEKL